MVLVLAVLGACAGPPPQLPVNAVVGVNTHPPGSMVAVSATAPPQIVGMAFNSLDVARGSTWSGDIITSSNVASVEVRSNLFSIDVPRTAFGRFHFDIDVFDVPPIFVRTYAVRVIARNAAGVEAEEDVPFRIR